MTLTAFYNPAGGEIVITGKNDSPSIQNLEGMKVPCYFLSGLLLLG